MSKFKPNQTTLPARKPARAVPAPAQSYPSADPALSNRESAGFEAAPEEEDESAGGVQFLGGYAALVFIFFRFSFLHEFIGAKLNANLHIVIVVGGLSYLCCLLSGRPLRAFKERSTLLWLGFGVCMALATVTSFWKGGSFPIFWAYIETALPAVLVMPALIVTRPQISKSINAIGLACITTTLLGTINDDFRSGRMGVDVASSEIENPNDYAAFLILMLPALAFWSFRKGRTVFHKIFGSACMALCLRQILSSGSRGALLSLSITTLFILLTGSKRIKAAILIGVPVLALAAIPFVPAESLARLSTLYSSSAAAKDGSATESSEARMALLQESWKLTLQNPLTGVGPGEFMDFQAKVASENGQRGMWHVTHNSYTQVSSECGFPAFLCFVGAILTTFVNLRTVIKSKDPELAPVAYTMSVMLVAYGVCIFFLSQAYTPHLLTLSALVVSMKLRISSRSQDPESTHLDPRPEVVPA